ncbi:MAG: transposase [Anaerolineales bacterium]|nr:transposase [Anaerolineales bacterium]
MKRSQPAFCRPNQQHLSNKDAHHYISEQLSHLLSNATEGYNCNRQTVSDIVVKASVTGAAIEGACNALTDAPTGMTVRSYLNNELSVMELQEIECKMQTLLKVDLPKRLWKKPLDLAMDFHDEPFYGKDPTLRAYACRGEAYKGTTWFYRIATVYVVHHQIPYTLGSVFILPEYSIQDILKALLHQIQSLQLQIRGLYLDKGFCVEPVISFLTGKSYEVIIACPIRGRKGGTRALCKGRKSYFTQYTFHADKPKAYTVPLTIVRTYEQRHSKRHAVWLLYVTLNRSTKNPQTIRARYRSRFGIESSYRCMRQTHAMTTSRNPALRFFLLALAFLILNLWCVLRWRFCQIPRRGGRFINPKAYELQRHRQFLTQVIDEKYHLLSCILAKVAPLDQ